MPPEYLSPSAYADHRGVDRSRVSRYIKAGQIPPKAIDGVGRAMRINVALADNALGRTLDKGQQLAKVLKADNPMTPPKSSKPKLPRGEAEPIPSAGHDEPDGSEPDYTFEKARLAKAQADAQEMKNSQARGEVLGVEEVVQRWSAIVSGARSALLAVPKRLRDVLPDLSAPDLAKVDAEIRRALESLGDGKFAM